ncbi:hypothetical protein [Lutimonas zeaxanthinifaciens]|uniref:hypothetical protein n=1 Tax=Lutimonas zeaxanthinifaciens TaxID=3060215 RepID=UPI00265CEBAB|nr:hypothetical protein [Lutimonas sp. YSD2104]WKK67458.1 hypothetical protein QZH61_07470 [Lutimonas sp. YSD2104]
MSTGKFLFLILLILLSGCGKADPEVDAVARVGEIFLTKQELDDAMPQGLSEEDSLLFRNNYIKMWATKELLLDKARINVEDDGGEIENLVRNYEKELLIDKYKRALLQQELDTLITEEDMDEYYESNKNVYRLNEDLIQLKYIHFSNDLNDKKEVIRLFKSKDEEDLQTLIDRELEFNSFSFNDSIWVSLKDVENRLSFLRDEKKIKKDQFIQKEDSLGVYLLAVRDIRERNNIAPKNYVLPTIRQMILHKRKLELMNEIEKTLMVDAINKKQFEAY